MNNQLFINPLKTKDTARTKRIAKEIQNILMNMFLRGEIKDYYFYQKIISISYIQVTKDLSLAVIYIIPSENDDHKELLKALKRISSFLKRKLFKELKIKMGLNLHFKIDNTLDNIERMEKSFALMKEK